VVVVLSWAKTVEPARRERPSAAAAMVFIDLSPGFRACNSLLLAYRLSRQGEPVMN
jgi:hypothetical protein